MRFTIFDKLLLVAIYGMSNILEYLFNINLYPVLEDAERSEADSTHGEASNH